MQCAGQIDGTNDALVDLHVPFEIGVVRVRCRHVVNRITRAIHRNIWNQICFILTEAMSHELLGESRLAVVNRYVRTFMALPSK